MNLTRGFLIFLALALLGGCATMPTGPTVAAMPGPGKPFEVFQADDYACRQWAQGADRRSVAKPDRQPEPRHRSCSRNAGRRRARCADRLCLGPCGRRRRNRRGGRPPHRNRYRERSGRFFRVYAPEALRHGLSAMHVCEGKPGPRCPAGASLWAAASSARLWASTAGLWATARLRASAAPSAAVEGDRTRSRPRLRRHSMS